MLKFITHLGKDLKKGLLLNLLKNPRLQKQ